MNELELVPIVTVVFFMVPSEPRVSPTLTIAEAAERLGCEVADL